MGSEMCIRDSLRRLCRNDVSGLHVYGMVEIHVGAGRGLPSRDGSGSWVRWVLGQFSAQSCGLWVTQLWVTVGRGSLKPKT